VKPGGSLCMSVLPHVRSQFCGFGGDFLPYKAGPRGNNPRNKDAPGIGHQTLGSCIMSPKVKDKKEGTPQVIKEGTRGMHAQWSGATKVYGGW
jgi:hypothetical protein